jgi:hypothetical protein
MIAQCSHSIQYIIRSISSEYSNAVILSSAVLHLHAFGVGVIRWHDEMQNEDLSREVYILSSARYIIFELWCVVYSSDRIQS